MRQRIGLAQALINDPELVILDEPTSGLDPLGTRWMKDLILELRNQGKTVIMCSHRLEDVQDVCDRIAILNDGELQELGEVKTLLEDVQRAGAAGQRRAAQRRRLRRDLEAVLRKHGGKLEIIGHPTTTLEGFSCASSRRARRIPADVTCRRSNRQRRGWPGALRRNPWKTSSPISRNKPNREYRP